MVEVEEAELDAQAGGAAESAAGAGVAGAGGGDVSQGMADGVAVGDATAAGPAGGTPVRSAHALSSGV